MPALPSDVPPPVRKSVSARIDRWSLHFPRCPDWPCERRRKRESPASNSLPCPPSTHGHRYSMRLVHASPLALQAPNVLLQKVLMVKCDPAASGNRMPEIIEMKLMNKRLAKHGRGRSSHPRHGGLFQYLDRLPPTEEAGAHRCARNDLEGRFCFLKFAATRAHLGVCDSRAASPISGHPSPVKKLPAARPPAAEAWRAPGRCFARSFQYAAPKRFGEHAMAPGQRMSSLNPPSCGGHARKCLTRTAALTVEADVLATSTLAPWRTPSRAPSLPRRVPVKVGRCTQ